MISRAELADTDFADIDSDDVIPNVRPGDVLRCEFMKPLGITAYSLARSANAPANRITGILHGTRAITADTALRLAAQLGTSAEV